MAVKYQGGKAISLQTPAERYVQMELQKVGGVLSALWNSPQRKELTQAQQAKLKTGIDALSDLYFRELKG